MDFIQFIQNIYRTTDFIPLHEPRFRGNEKKYINDCIDSTFVSSVGKYVDQFEKDIALYTGAKYAVAAVNGTAALHIALMLAGVKADEEVITQPLTFIATANAISYTGAKPVFVDVDRDTMGLSPNSLRDFLENETTKLINPSTNKPSTINKKTGRRIAAVVPMHTFGHPARIDEIKILCDEYHIALIEDAAESLGSFYKGQHTGTFGLMGTLSFNGNKTITTGGGGMIITNDEKLAKMAKHLTTQAKVPHAWEYRHDYIGYNYRLTNLAAALGVAQLEQLPEILKSKRELASQYKAFFAESEIQFATEPENSQSNYWLNAVLLENRDERDKFLKYTNENGVMTRPIWELMNRLPMFKDCQVENIENSELLADRVVNIPSSVI
ncbi:MAG: LegC family aminotransferase [Bacteroidales bacterium]|nr:LegC family aminotransferase [Bacteroidales bacterium]